MVLTVATLLGVTCIAMNPGDVREAAKLVRAAYVVPDTARARLLVDSPRCRRIAAAAGYRQGRVAVLNLGQLYAVFDWDEMIVLDEHLRRAQPRSP